MKSTLAARALILAAGLSTAAGAFAQAAAPAAPAAPAPVSAAKKELVAKVLQLQRPGIEAMARQMAEQPALQMLQSAGPALQRLPAEQRESVARELQADARKYAEDATAVVRERAVRLAPSTVGALLEERFTEDELREVVRLLESPVNRKFQAAAPDMQRALGEKLVAETRPLVEPKVSALQATMARRLEPAAPASAPKK